MRTFVRCIRHDFRGIAAGRAIHTPRNARCSGVVENSAPPTTVPELLRESLRLFVNDVLGYLRANCQPPVFGAMGPHAWVRSQQELFRYERPAIWLRCSSADGVRAAIRDLASYTALDAAMRDDPWIARHLDGVLVGTPLYRSRVDLDTVIEVTIIEPLIRHAGTYDFDEDRYTSLAEPFLSALAAPTVTVRRIVPLQGFIGWPNPLGLHDGAVVRLLSDDEISALTAYGTLPMVVQLGSLRVTRSDQWCVSEDWILPKQFGAIDSFHVVPPAPETNEAADRFVIACRLIAPGPIARGSLSTVHDLQPFGMGMGTTTELRALQRPLPHRDPVILDGARLASVLQVYSQLRAQQVLSAKPLQLALRRFADAALRVVDEDMVLDLMIAAEALFLPDTGKDRGELGYRLALRAALFVPEAAGTATQVRSFMKRAYDARSRIVHGNSLPELRSLDGSVALLPLFVTQLEQVLRLSLLKAVRHAASSGVMSSWKSLEDRLIDNGSPPAESSS